MDKTIYEVLVLIVWLYDKKCCTKVWYKNSNGYRIWSCRLQNLRISVAWFILRKNLPKLDRRNNEGETDIQIGGQYQIEWSGARKGKNMYPITLLKIFNCLEEARGNFSISFHIPLP